MFVLQPQERFKELRTFNLRQVMDEWLDYVKKAYRLFDDGNGSFRMEWLHWKVPRWKVALSRVYKMEV